MYEVVVSEPCFQRNESERHGALSTRNQQHHCSVSACVPAEQSIAEEADIAAQAYINRGPVLHTAWTSMMSQSRLCGGA